MKPFAPSIMAITDVARFGQAHTLQCMEALCALAKPGSVCVQLRDLAMDARQKLLLGKQLVAMARRHGQWLSVNDHLHVAALLGVQVIHLGEASVTTLDARAFMRTQGVEIVVSRACHRPEQVGDLDAEAAVLSPVFAERKGRAALGHSSLVQALARADGRASESPCKVFALGGVTADSVAMHSTTPSYAVAVMGAVYGGRGELERLVTVMGLKR